MCSYNAVFNDTHATLSADEKTIFFASDRLGDAAGQRGQQAAQRQQPLCCAPATLPCDSPEFA